MRQPVDARGRRAAAIHQQDGAPGLQPLEATFHQAGRRAATAAGLRQDQLDQGRLLLLRAVEQRQAAIAVPHRAQRRGHALDGGGQRGRRLRLGGLQQGADLDQILQSGELGRWAALGVAAVARTCRAISCGRKRNARVRKAACSGRGDRGGDQPLEGGQRPRVQLFRRQGGGQPGGIRNEAGHQPLAEHVVGRGREEVVMPEPGGEPRTGHVRAVRHRVAIGGGNPVAHQRPGARAGSVRAEGAQVPQPGEAMGRRAQDGGRGGVAQAPGRSGSGMPLTSSSPFISRAPRAGSPGQGSRTGKAGASGTRPIRRLGSRAIARRASRSQREPAISSTAMRRWRDGSPFGRKSMCRRPAYRSRPPGCAARCWRKRRRRR